MSARVFVSLVVWGILGYTAGAQNLPPYATREVLVKFAPGVSTGNLPPELDVELVKAVGGSGWVRVRSRTRDTSALSQTLSQRADVRRVEPNYVLKRQKLPGENLDELWGLTKVSAPAAWDKTTGSRGVVVGVLDSGVDYNHTDLAGNVWSSPFEFSVDFPLRRVTCAAGTRGFDAITGRCNPIDDNNHGTHVSGIIGAEANNTGVVGTNWFTTILPLKFLDSSGSGFTSDAVDAIFFARQLKRQGVNIRVLSASWGGGSYSQALYDEIQMAGDDGMLFVAAAGNNGSNNDTDPFYPASFNLPNLIAVAATDSADALPSWSNYGATRVHLGAPGVGIRSTVPGSSYSLGSGTSMAAPYVAGTAALVLSAAGCTSLTVGELKNVLLNSVDAAPALIGKTVTAGRLNVNKAVSNCAGTPDFTLTAPTNSRASRQGQLVTIEIKIIPSGTFFSPVNLSVADCPPNALCAFSANPAWPGSVLLAVVSPPSTPAGTYYPVVTAVSGAITRTLKLSVAVRR